ncbi:MAG: discoidin domain-containing protein, partial [Phycisphaerae bacterium]|nr:discoidin domain-containing protein [Phycisphaerae bacterium]
STTVNNGASAVLFGPNGDVYVMRITGQAVYHLEYDTGAFIGTVVPTGGSTVNDVSGGTVVLQSGGNANVESMTFGDIGGPTGFGLAHTDGVPDLIVNRRDKIEIYDGTSLDKTGTGSETWGTLLFQKYRADSAGNIEDGTGGQGVAFGPNYGLANLYVMKGVNAATSGVYEGRFHIYDLSSPTLEDTAYTSGQGQRDSGTMLLGPDVNGDGRNDLWSIDNRSNRINAYDTTTGDRLVTAIPIVNEQGVPCPSNGLRFPTNIAHGPGGSILVTTRFRTWLDPSWTGAEQAGGNLVQLVWDKENLRAVAALVYELPDDTGRLDGVVYLGADLAVARDPSPSNGATDVIRDTLLSWTPGQSATAHDVYLGTSASDIDAASRDNPMGVLVSQGQTATTFDPPGSLAFGQMYYWRVDDVNGPASTVVKGGLWSFTVEPVALPIEGVKATASNSFNNTSIPAKTVDGSGLNAAGQHSVDIADMWLSSTTGPQSAWILYEFDKVYKLHEMWVWNSNQVIEPALGYGAREVGIEVSTDGTTWTALAGATEFAQGTGEPTYTYNTTVDFGGALARYVRLTLKSNWSQGVVSECSLSEVRFFYIPVWATGPKPAAGATAVAVDSTLSWRPGREAVQHEVYIGSDPNATPLAKTVTDHQVALSSLGVEYGRTYYWKVDEVNEAAVPRSWAGEVWSFATLGYATVDDFENYNDKCKRIFFTWIDGYGHSGSADCGIAPSTGNGTGSTVGNISPPFASQTVVHSGRQAMRLAYDNTSGSGIAETVRAFDTAQDWTLGGVKTLVLYFLGDTTNGAGQLYVKVNGTKVQYGGSSSAIAMGLWKQWDIDLSAVPPASLKTVTSLTFGVSGTGKGDLYVDDIRLYGQAPAVAAPTDPGTGALAAYYAFEGDTRDTAGEGYDGTLVNDPTFGDSKAGLGKALALDGVNDYVDLPIGTLISTLTSATVSAWIHFDTASTGSYVRVFDFGTSSTAGYMFLCPRQGTTGVMRFAITTGTNTGESGVNAPRTLTAGWHHVAVVIDGVARTLQLVVDGEVVASGATNTVPRDLGVTTQNWLGRSQYTADSYYTGGLDEFRIYSRALSAGEVRYLAGDR